MVLLIGVTGTILWLNWGLFDHTQDNNLRENNSSEIMVKPTAYVITDKGEKINVEPGFYVAESVKERHF